MMAQWLAQGAEEMGQAVQVVLHTLGGEAAVPRFCVAAGATVGAMLRQLPREWGPRELLAVALGDRRLEEHERFGDLEACRAQGCVVLTLLRQPVDMVLVEGLRLKIRGHKLDMFDDIGDVELVAVADLLQDPGVALKTLHLRTARAADITPLAEALRVNSSLATLCLTGAGVCDVSALAQALRVNASLEELYLSHTGVSDVSPLAETLQVNNRLKVLNLGNTDVVDVGALAGALRVNTGLRALHLHNTQISDVSALAEALRVNTGLQELHLYGTRVADIGALSEALRVNSTLQCLSLTWTNVRDVRGLVDALGTNRAIRWLRLGGCALPVLAQEQLRAMAREEEREFSVHL